MIKRLPMSALVKSVGLVVGAREFVLAIGAVVLGLFLIWLQACLFDAGWANRLFERLMFPRKRSH